MGSKDFIFRVNEVPAPRTYEVRTGFGGLGDFHTITIDDRTGALTIDGSYGTFAYRWTSYGQDRGVTLHEFLYDLDFDYFMNKASKQPYRIPDWKSTKKDMLSRVLEERRARELTKDDARYLFDLTVSAFERDPLSEGDFYSAFEDYKLYDFFMSDGGYNFRTMVHPGMQNFWDEVWLPFCTTVLKKHVRAEGEVA